MNETLALKKEKRYQWWYIIGFEIIQRKGTDSASLGLVNTRRKHSENVVYLIIYH